MKFEVSYHDNIKNIAVLICIPDPYCPCIICTADLLVIDIMTVSSSNSNWSKLVPFIPYRYDMSRLLSSFNFLPFGGLLNTVTESLNLLNKEISVNQQYHVDM